MAVYGSTRDELIEMLCQLILHDWVGGTATGGSTASLVDTSRLEEDNYFNSRGAYLYLRTGTYKGSNLKVMKSVNTSHSIIFEPVLAGNVSAGDTYSIHSEFMRSTLNAAINAAIQIVAEDALDWKINETTTLIAGAYEYDIPSGFEFINKITMADSNGKFYGDSIPPDQYSIIPGGTAKIKFLAFPEDEMPAGIWVGEYWIEANFTAGRKLQIEGLSRASALSTDTDTCAISPGYIINQAGALLLGGQAGRSENDPRDYAGKAKVCQAQANAERALIVPMQLPINSKRCRA